LLAQLIVERDLSQRALAAATKIPVSAISELLSGKRSFAVSHIQKLAAHFKVSPAVFLTS
jgi:antitoxin component HigA of HigAB toxin-antitoxin module